mgnify:CR=1 FL=1
MRLRRLRQRHLVRRRLDYLRMRGGAVRLHLGDGLVGGEDARSLIERAAPISVRQDNPKKGASALRYAKYMAATTAKEYIDLGGSRADLKHDINKGFVKVLVPAAVPAARAAACDGRVPRRWSGSRASNARMISRSAFPGRQRGWPGQSAGIHPARAGRHVPRRGARYSVVILGGKLQRRLRCALVVTGSRATRGTPRPCRHLAQFWPRGTAIHWSSRRAASCSRAPSRSLVGRTRNRARRRRGGARKCVLCRGIGAIRACATAAQRMSRIFATSRAR